jgi:hypothetical protein
MKKIILKEEIGNGSHWRVIKIVTDENGNEKSIIHKKTISSLDNVERNINNYLLISSCGLPTLNEYKQIDNETIETEDLNQDTQDGYFVSPNTIRCSPTCAHVLLKLIKRESISEFEMEECKDFDFQAKLKYKSESSFDELRNKLIVKSVAEHKVYNHKIKEISNLEAFMNNAQIDMKKASKSKIELFFDAFFFRVKLTTNKIEYVIADFDTIIQHKKHINEQNLFNGNMEYLKTALSEYITYFVVNEKHKEYNEIINKY